MTLGTGRRWSEGNRLLWGRETVGPLDAATARTVWWAFIVPGQPLASSLPPRGAQASSVTAGQAAPCGGSGSRPRRATGEQTGLFCLHLRREAPLPPSPSNRKVGRRHESLVRGWTRSGPGRRPTSLKRQRGREEGSVGTKSRKPQPGTRAGRGGVPVRR